MLSSITWYAFLPLSPSLSSAADATHYAIVAITVPATTMLTMSHFYPCKQAYKGRHFAISCDKCFLPYQNVVLSSLIA